MRDIHSMLDILPSITAQAVTATNNGAGVDLANFDAAEVILSLGVFAGTTPAATIKIQESSDNSAFTDVDPANLIGGALPAIDVAAANQVHKRGYIGYKRYIRVIVSAISGTSASLPMSAVVARGHGRKKP